jgi:hypothetical protein
LMRGPRKADLARLRKMVNDMARAELRLKLQCGPPPAFVCERTSRILDQEALQRVIEWIDAATARPR